MIIEPKEFLERTIRLGVHRHDYKGMMDAVTQHPSSIDQAIRNGMNFYFGYTIEPVTIRCIVDYEHSLPLMDAETYTDAFKLLRVLSD
jgi:hypothetical protein